MGMLPPDPVRGDLHVHSTFSDGLGTVGENLRAAEAAGLTHLGCVDHVRQDSTWVPEYVAEVRRLAGRSPLHVTAGVEAKILTTDGELDLPRDLGGADLIYAADHQWPTPWGPVHPRDVRSEIEAGTTRPATLLGWLVHGICGALRRHAGSVVLAHPFSILPKAGLSEDDLTDQQIAQVALSARWSWAVVEISERWHCPGTRALAAFRAREVPLVLSTDAHRPGDIGRYHRALELLQSGTGGRAAA